MEIKAEGLVWIGRVIAIDDIQNADFIACATVVCGSGGKWKGIVKKGQFSVPDRCIVYLPDSIIPQSDDMKFMEASNWRVKMRRFRGAPSEVVIMPLKEVEGIHLWDTGRDITEEMKVTKYFKPIPANLAGKAKGDFPGFIPKTDEMHYQQVEQQAKLLIGMAYYVTEKADGSSTTAYRYKDEFGVCSRNWELLPEEHNGYWQMARKYELESNLPEGIALQWETCGPGIQSNPMGLKEISAFAFSAYNIHKKRYLTYLEFDDLCSKLKFPKAKLVECGDSFSLDGLELKGEGVYDNSKQREGVVIRSLDNLLGHKPVSFKVINLNYEK